MPKVNEAHYEKKKEEILEAARRVCISKPIYNVAMRDIVIEAGMSQGGVYKYFSNIDEVFVALLNQSTLSHKVKVDVEVIFNASKNPLDIMDDFLKYVGKYVEEAVMGSGKIYFELTNLYANEPDRFMKVKDQILEVSNLEYLQKQFNTFILEQVEDKYFHPVVQLEDIFTFILTFINGLTHDAILAYNFPEDQRLMPAPNIENLIKTLSLTVRKLLGC